MGNRRPSSHSLIGQSKAALDTPALLVDLAVMEANIARTAKTCRDNGVALPGRLEEGGQRRDVLTEARIGLQRAGDLPGPPVEALPGHAARRLGFRLLGQGERESQATRIVAPIEKDRAYVERIRQLPVDGR